MDVTSKKILRNKPKEKALWLFENWLNLTYNSVTNLTTDFEKGFIRAEVIAYDDFISLGSEQACRDNGKLSVEGKEYIVKDGDVMNFRFNV